MALDSRQITSFFGGIAESEAGKQEMLGSFSYIAGLNYRKYPDSLVLADKLVKDSGTKIEATPLWMVRDTNGEHYVQDSNTDVYEENGGTYTKVRDLSGTAAGTGLAIFTAASTRYLFYGQNTQLGRVDVPSRGTFTDNYQTLTAADVHPMLPYSNLLVIGNDEALATLDDSANWDASRVTMPTGHKVRCTASTPDYIVIGSWRGQSYYQGEGRLTFWDGGYANWNFQLPVPEGGVNTMWSIPGGVMLLAGGRGAMYRWRTGVGLERIRHLPAVPTSTFWQGSGSVTSYPSAGSYWNGLSYFGTATEDSTEPRVAPFVYSYGSNNTGYPETLNAELAISAAGTDGALEIADVPATATTNYKIGFVYPSSSTELYVGWKAEGSPDTFGVDLIDLTDFCPKGFFISRTVDFDVPDIKKDWESSKFTFETLTSSDEVLEFSYITDRDKSFALTDKEFDSVSYTTDDSGEISEKRFGDVDTAPSREFQFLVKLIAASSTSPRLYSCKVNADVETTDA